VLNLRLAWLAAICYVVAPAAQDFGEIPDHLQFARQLLSQVEPGNTSYRHKQTEVNWMGPDGPAVCNTDCSGFLNALLERAYGFDKAKLKKVLGKRRPEAINYFQAIMQATAFKRITNITESQSGDMIAIRYPTGSDNTGHTMLIDGPPVMHLESSPKQASLQQWEVPVIDVSESGHGPLDTRSLPSRGFRKGLGRGIFRIYTDWTGEIRGYTWSLVPQSVFYGPETRPLVIGRYQL
jgi:hypothetical protein